MVIIGVDEAGKGPVIGSMFVAAISVTEEADLPEKVDDSKRLSPSRRRELYDSLRSIPDASISVVEISVERIDRCRSMTRLTARTHAEAIDRLDGDDAASGTLDAATDPDRFVPLVEEHLNTNLNLNAEFKADESVDVVAAASILAKEARERHVLELAEQYDVPIGSGYPSDERTIEFLESYVEEHGDLPDCARRSWETSQDILADHRQTGLGDF